MEGLVANAVAVEGVANVHEGSSYFAERVIRRAIKQGTLKLGRDPNEYQLMEAL